MKKLIMLVLSFLLLVGCSKDKEVKTLSQYEDVYLSDATTIEYDEEFNELYAPFGKYSGMHIIGDENGNIREINLDIATSDRMSDEITPYIVGLLEYTNTFTEPDYSQKIANEISNFRDECYEMSERYYGMRVRDEKVVSEGERYELVHSVEVYTDKNDRVNEINEFTLYVY